MAENRNKSSLIAIVSINLMVLSAMLTGCNARTPNLLSKSQEIQLGKQLSAEQAEQSQFITSGPEYERLKRVEAKLIPLAKADYDVPYTVQLIDSQEVNAFAAPGGPIYFYLGLMKLASSDDEVASVLGHEATHIVKRHSAKQISDQILKSNLAAIFLGNQGELAQVAASLLINFQGMKFSSDDEGQSDENGFRSLVRAGYNPDAMASFFEKMGKAAGSSGSPEWLQSHPLTDTRVKKARQRAEDYKSTGALP